MDSVAAQTIERTQGRYYGKYRGFVVDNQDPDKRGRLRLRVPSVLASEVSAWALPCLPFGGLADQGFFMIPEVDAQIWVEFEEGNLHAPIWTGVFWQQPGDVPSEGAKSKPTTRVLKTPSGHVLQFDDEKGSERFRLFHPKGAEMIIDEKGTVDVVNAGGERLVLNADSGEVVLEDSNGNKLTMNSSGTVVEDANGNKIEMAAAGVTVKGTKIVIEGSQVAVGSEGGEPLIKGTTFLSWLATHTHNCTAPGSPSGPPVPPPNPSFLTTKTTAT
jgi:uncharacterized protein involved in type VI secretion and phage assembly